MADLEAELTTAIKTILFYHSVEPLVIFNTLQTISWSILRDLQDKEQLIKIKAIMGEN